jgi:hypothetical protein
MVRRIPGSSRALVLILVVILLLGFARRLSFARTEGFTFDTRLFARWARLMARGGLEAVYGQSPSAYPPLGSVLLLPVGLMCPRCDLDAAPTLGELFVLRLLCTGFDLLNAAVLFQLGRKVKRSWGGLAAAAIYLLFPGMVLVSGWWPQNDAWLIFFMLTAGMFLARKRTALAWGCLALSILIKLQAVILLPVFLAGTWRWYGGKRLALGCAVFVWTLAAFCAPVLAGGNAASFMAAITLPTRQDPVVYENHITLGGHNLWAGIALLKHLDIRGSYHQAVMGEITFDAAGTSLLLLGLALVAVRVFMGSAPRSVFAAVAMTWLIFFQFAIGSAARYLIPAAVFLLVVALEYPLAWIACIGLQLTAFFNLQDTIHSGFDPFPWAPLPGGIATNVLLTMVFTLMAMGLFLAPVSQASDGKRFCANRVEQILVKTGLVVLVIFLGVWLQQSATIRGRLDQASKSLTNSVRQEADNVNVLAINWPKVIEYAPSNAHLLLPSTGLAQSSLDEMGIVSATTVIYLPWAEAANRVYGWNLRYHGYHVTAEMLVERIFQARRVVALNMVTNAPRMWRLAEIYAKMDGAAPVARWDAGVQLISARLEYRDRTVLARLAWNVTQPIPDDVTVFVHLLGPDGQLVTQLDGDTIQNLIPLGQWQRYPNRVVEETRLGGLPEGAPRGLYTAVVGLYNRATAERLPMTCVSQPCENQAYRLEPIQVEPENP